MKVRSVKRLSIKRGPYNQPDEFQGLTPDDEKYLRSVGFTILGNGDILAKIWRWEDDHSFIHVYPHLLPEVFQEGGAYVTSFHSFEVNAILNWPS